MLIAEEVKSERIVSDDRLIEKNASDNEDNHEEQKSKIHTQMKKMPIQFKSLNGQKAKPPKAKKKF